MPVSSNFRNTYSSQFVPLPLEQFARTNELNQAKQDSQVAQLEQTDDALWKVKGIADADNEYLAGFKTSFESAAGSLVNKDLTQRENQDNVKALVKGVARDKDLSTIMVNASKYQEWQENVAAAKKDGTYTRENDLGEASFRQYAANGGYKSGAGIDSTVIKYSEERPVMEKSFDNMGENGSDAIKQAGEVFYKDGWKGITSG